MLTSASIQLSPAHFDSTAGRCLCPTINAMSDVIGRMSHAEFLALIAAGILTDDEIAVKIRSYPPRGIERAELLQAVATFKGGPISGPIRTAIRGLDGLPPVPED